MTTSLRIFVVIGGMFLLSPLAFSGDKYVHFLSKGDKCLLRQVGSNWDPGRKDYSGKYIGGKNTGICTVFIEKNEFEKQFEFCFLTGVRLDAIGEGMCQFSSVNKEKYAFEWTVKPGYPGPLNCDWTCIKK